MVRPLMAHEWKTLCVDGQFCFDYPAELIADSSITIDSTAGTLSSESMKLMYDYGRYSSDFDELSDAKITEVIVDGKDAIKFISQKVIALHVAQVREIPGMGSYMKLSIEIQFVDDTDHQLAQKTFESIRFLIE